MLDGTQKMLVQPIASYGDAVQHLINIGYIPLTCARSIYRAEEGVLDVDGGDGTCMGCLRARYVLSVLAEGYPTESHAPDVHRAHVFRVFHSLSQEMQRVRDSVK